MTEELIDSIANGINGNLISNEFGFSKKEYPNMNTGMGVGFGWKGTLIETRDNKIGLKLRENSNIILLSKFIIENKNSGLGIKIMNIIIDYANKNNKIIWLEDVINKKFFQKFGELEFISIENGKKTYQLNAYT